MKITKLLKEIKGVFVPPKKNYYFGRVLHGAPYFYPINFNKTILSIRKLKLRNKEEFEKLSKERYWSKEQNKFSNLPMVRRTKDWIVKIFNNYYFIAIGWPIVIKNTELGWKWKWDDIRHEYSPSFQIYFFKWQFCIFWNAPDGKDTTYYEMILNYLKKYDRDIEKTRSNWGWVNYATKKSTWNDDYLIKNEK